MQTTRSKLLLLLLVSLSAIPFISADQLAFSDKYGGYDSMELENLVFVDKECPELNDIKDKTAFEERYKNAYKI